MTEEKNECVPRLRFPLFIKTKGWVQTTISNIAKEPLSNGIFNDPARKGAGYYIINVKDMYLSTTINDNHILQEINLSDNELKNKVYYGDIFFTRSSLVPSGIAHSNIYTGSSKKVTFDEHLIRLRVNNCICTPLFINFLLKTYSVHRQLVACGKTATMTTISQKDIEKTIIHIPTIAEQQKIADCLSSLDELIEAREQKCNALKQHKKGLMQRLFPAEGETTPRWRFPEFRDSGEWLPYKIEDIFTVTRGEVLPMTKVKSTAIAPFIYPVYSSQTKNNGLAGFYSEYLYEDAITWTTDGANAGDTNFREGKFYCTNVCGVLLNNDGYANKCIAELINRISKNHVSYVGNPKLMNNVMKKINISIPSLPEQQKIADCLSSLDDRIAAEEERLTALREHKKGLLQQLFPRYE